MSDYFKTKNINVQIKDVDMSKRTVSGYFAKFGNEDSDGDIIVKGAFAKTIAENGVNGKDRIKHLKNHNPNHMIGKLVELKEDDFGLFFVSTMSKNSHGQDALIEYQEGMLTEHSIGYIEMETNKDEQSGINYLKELKMWEGSAVTWGANSETPVVDIKSAKYEDLVKELDDVTKYCKLGELSDGLLYSVEIKIRQIQQELKERQKDAEEKKPLIVPGEVDLLAVFNKKLKV